MYVLSMHATLKPGLAKYAVDASLFRLGSEIFFKFTRKIRNRLNRKINQILDFSDFYFSSYGNFLVIFILKSPQFLMNFHANSKNKNRKNHFSFVSAHCTSSIKTESKQRGVVVCISLVGKYL